jgi:hypothetical protein
MTRGELVARLREQAVEAERRGYTAPVAAVLRDVAEQVEQVTGLVATPGPDRLLTLTEAAERLGLRDADGHPATRWFSEHPDAPFLRRLTRRTVRVSEQGLARWLATTQPE